MTKKELIEALEPYPDDVEIVRLNSYGDYEYIAIEVVQDEGETCISVY